MRKAFALGVTLITTIILLQIVLASSSFQQPAGQKQGQTRLIVRTTSLIDKVAFIFKGCTITHNLQDAVSLECPNNVQIANSEPDQILHVVDVASANQINANLVWPSYTGSGVTVAVLDTGIDYTSIQLSSASGSVDPTNGHCFAVTAKDCGNGFFDDMGHGTHVSGIIASAGIADAYNGKFSKGVAPGVKVWMAKVCNGMGSCYTSDIAAAIQYVVTNHVAKVMSISLGGGGTRNATCDSDYLASQVNWAFNNGVVSVVAAGNDGLYDPGMVSSPACASDAIAVSAVDSSDMIASFSSFGAAVRDHGVAAPGVNIYSTVPKGSCTLCNPTGYTYLSGTSMATPHVSATVALMLQKNSTLTSTDIRTKIFSGANCLNNKYGTCPNIYIGYGRVNALASVNLVKPLVTTTTTMSTTTSTTTICPRVNPHGKCVSR